MSDKVDPVRVAAKIAELVAEAESHDRTASILRDLSDDECRESLRIRRQADACQALLNAWREPGDPS